MQLALPIMKLIAKMKTKKMAMNIEAEISHMNIKIELLSVKMEALAVKKKNFFKYSNKILKFHSQTDKRNMHCTAKVELANLLEKMAHIAILNTKLQIIYQVYKHGLMILRTYLT